MSPHLARRRDKASAHPDLVLTSLYHPSADIDHVRTCSQLRKGNKAVGSDAVTKAMSADDLEANLHDVSARLTRMGTRPQPKLRVSIPKPGSEQGRPRGMSSFEDTIVEWATTRGGEPLVESLCDACSYGDRPKRSPHQCLDGLGRTIQHQRVNHSVEADIRGFVAAVHHEWVRTCLRQRIGDERVLRLIGRMVQAGIMEDGRVQVGEVGTPQGSMLSPVRSNVSLHSVLDIWLQRRGRRQCRGAASVFRVADDCVACFQYQSDAESFLESLGHRMGAFHLELAEEQTPCLECGRSARAKAHRRGEKPKDFACLGMPCLCGTPRHGAFKVTRKTSRKKLQHALARLTEWIRRCRNRFPTGELRRRAQARMQGHVHDYAITDNAERCELYGHLTRRVLCTWLNRRSQRTSYTWEGLQQAMRHVGWPQERVRVHLNPCARLHG